MSRTQEALDALNTAIAAKAAESSSPLSPPLRNEALPARLFQPVAGGPQKFLNVWDGEGEPDPDGETLGAEDPGVSDGYAIEHRAKIEWVVAGGTEATRRAAFDAGLIALHDAVKRGNDGTYLGGVVNMVAFERVARAGQGLVTDGLPNVLAAEITVLLTFTSDRPF
jgi:hypothetical protein